MFKSKSVKSKITNVLLFILLELIKLVKVSIGKHGYLTNQMKSQTVTQNRFLYTPFFTIFFSLKSSYIQELNQSQKNPKLKKET